MAIESSLVDTKTCRPVKLPLSREAYIKAMVVGLDATNAVQPSPLCVDPMSPMVATLAIFKAILYSNSVIPKDKEQVTQASSYLAKWILIVATLVNKNMLTVVAFYNTITHGNRGRWRAFRKTLLFDVAYGLAYRVLFTRFVELDGDIHLYLAAMMMATLGWAGEALVIPEGMKITTMTREAFCNMLLKEASHNNNNYRLFSR